jgi:hypothetical protein
MDPTQIAVASVTYHFEHWAVLLRVRPDRLDDRGMRLRDEARVSATLTRWIRRANPETATIVAPAKVEIERWSNGRPEIVGVSSIIRDARPEHRRSLESWAWWKSGDTIVMPYIKPNPLLR